MTPAAGSLFVVPFIMQERIRELGTSVFEGWNTEKKNLPRDRLGNGDMGEVNRNGVPLDNQTQGFCSFLWVSSTAHLQTPKLDSSAGSPGLAPHVVFSCTSVSSMQKCTGFCTSCGVPMFGFIVSYIHVGAREVFLFLWTQLDMIKWLCIHSRLGLVEGGRKILLQAQFCS